MRKAACIALAIVAFGGACKKKGENRQVTVPPPAGDTGGGEVAAARDAVQAPGPADAGAAPAAVDAAQPAVRPSPVLLLTQSRFIDELQPDGSTKSVPGPAALVILRAVGAEWEPETIEDADSNVFHKAMEFDPDGQGPVLLTIGAMGAYLKAWRKQGDSWSGTTLWHPTFGGEIDRLRDMEIGDVNADGRPEIVIATHDQGVVGVLTQVDGAWQPIELDKRPGIFVHEVEIGDIDGDGKNEFFTTPSQPNTTGAAQQGGGIDMYRWDGTTYVRTPVMWSDQAHAKEILVTPAGDGRDGLFGVLEARTEAGADCRQQADFRPLRIVRYNADLSECGAAELPDCMCRFLVSGDVDGDGMDELVAATKNAGLFLLRGGPCDLAETTPIDADSGGFEHATLVADLDGNGTAEIYVAADKQGQLRRYVWNAERKSFDRETIFELGGDQITWNVTSAALP